MIFDSPYTDMFLADAKRQLRRMLNSPKTLHRQTCYKCGRKLVNTYYDERTKTYMCKHCLDNMRKEDEGK